MYKRRRKILLLIFAIAGIWMMIIKNQDTEVFQEVKESELTEMVSNKKTQKSKKITKIRVLIMGNGYSGEVHPEVKISSKGKMCLEMEGKKEYIGEGEVLTLDADDKRVASGKLRISSQKKLTIESLERSQGTPSYDGVIEIRATAEGLVIINELSVEKYLKAVVPSEMPASYELEALKVQAVCARSYAYQQMKKYAYPEYKAHVNDSTEYQVYGNVKAYEKTNQAINETKGQVVYYQGEIATTYYFSTSCGKTTDIEAWGTQKSKNNGYLRSVKIKNKNGDFEKNLPWYRWKAEVSVENISNLIGLNTGKDIGQVNDIEITERGSGGIALELKAVGEKGSVTVETENKIRKTLGGRGYEIVLNDGSVTESRDLLPSAFFTIEKDGNVFVIEGGGFGHGIGMSQNGANEMAKTGMDYKEILERFYTDIEIH